MPGENNLPLIDPDMPGCFVIRNADEAWALLHHAQNGGDLPENMSLRFDGWPRYQIKVQGRDWHGTVPTRVMAPLLEVQRDLYRVYTNICYGETNLRKLRDEDRDLLELVVKVNEGSSEYDAPMWEQFSKVASEAIGKMESRDLVKAILGVALVVGGVEVGKAWIAERQQEKGVEQTVQLSEQETERLRIFAEAMRQQPVISSAKSDFVESQNRLLKTVKPADTVSTPGVRLHGHEVSEIVQPERARSEDIRIEGVFRVLANDTTKGAGFRIKVARLEDGMTFAANVPLELDAEQKRLIQTAEWSKGGKFVWLSINASILRGKIHDAIVEGATAVPD